VDDSSSVRRGGSPDPSHVIHLQEASSARAPSVDDAAAATFNIAAGPLFTIVWRALADVLGTAAAATLLRRAAQRALPRWPELAGLVITRESLEYRFNLPAAWWKPSAGPSPALCDLVRELCTLLVDLTGSVIVNRLAQIPELRSQGIIPELEVSS
jgi:hypothetical protein